MSLPLFISWVSSKATKKANYAGKYHSKIEVKLETNDIHVCST